MSKKAKTCIAIAAVVAILCLFPFPYAYSQTVSMTKLDATGETLDHVDVTFQYRASRSLLFGKQIKQITVDEFDGHMGISSSRICIDAEYDDVQSYYLYSSSATDSTSDLIDYFDVRFE